MINPVILFSALSPDQPHPKCLEWDILQPAPQHIYAALSDHRSQDTSVFSPGAASAPCRDRGAADPPRPTDGATGVIGVCRDPGLPGGTAIFQSV